MLLFLYLILLGIMVEGFDPYLFAQQPSDRRSPPIQTPDAMPAFVPDEILITFHPDATLDQIRAMNEAQGMTILEMNRASGLYRLRVPRPVQEAITLAQSQSFVESARPNYILAEVGDEIITVLDMESLIEEISPFLRRVYTRKEVKESLLNSLVDYKLFSRAAREENLDKLQEVKRVVNAAVEKKMAQVYLKKIRGSLSVSEKELRDYYEAHLKEFQTPEQVKVRHIVVRTEKEAEEILERIKGGADFGKIAGERSIDGTAQGGGELGWFGRGRMDPAFEEAAFALERGEVSGIVQTRFGYHIIQGEGRRGPEKQDFSAVRDRIRQNLWDRKQKEEIEKKRKELRARHTTRLYPELLSEVTVHETGDVDQRDLIRTLQEMVEKPY